jgi:adenylate kinase family enzyme
MLMFIMQGAPGSGKSTVARMLRETLMFRRRFVTALCSTDDFWSQPDGSWKFDRERIGEAHDWNKRQAMDAIKVGYNVIVDNTNVRAWEAAPYVKMAVAAGYQVQFLRCTGQFRSEHGVPDDLVAQMRASLEDLSVEKCLKAVPPWEAPFVPVI